MRIKTITAYSVIFLTPLAVWFIVPPQPTVLEVAAYFLGGLAIKCADLVFLTSAGSQ